MVSLIVKTIQLYHPEFDPPPDRGGVWNSCLCPFHGETNRSASISYIYNAFHCFACPVKGDVISIIRQEEGCGFAKAKSIAEGLSEGSNVAVSRGSTRQPRKRIFDESGIGLGFNSDSSQPLQDRIRW